MASIRPYKSKFRAIIRSKELYASQVCDTLAEAEEWVASVENAHLAKRKKLAKLEPVKPLPILLAPPAPEQIIEMADAYPRSAIYFLLLGSEIKYVGQSKNALPRLVEHIRHSGYGKNFDRYAMLPCPEWALTQIERHYIRLLSPEYNIDGVPQI